MIADAILSPCGRYRYLLARRWGPGKVLHFVMLNPSTADAEQDDPTIRKCGGFANLLGFQAFDVHNLYAYRATDPRALKALRNDIEVAIGPDNDYYLRTMAIRAASNAEPVICAWGAHARGALRPQAVTQLLRFYHVQLYALAFTDDGIPRHPLMLPYSASLKSY